MTAKAYLGRDDVFVTFPVNPYAVTWGYKQNIKSVDTLGGRVVQLLSTQLTSMNISTVAGSRRELQIMVDKLRKIMEYQMHTLNPVLFKYPARKWNFKVFLTDVPKVGWEVTTVTYPYSITLQIEEDLGGIKTLEIQDNSLKRLAEGIGYGIPLDAEPSGERRGRGDPYTADYRGGDAFKFQEIVSSLSLEFPGAAVETEEGGGGLGIAIATGAGQVIQGGGVKVKPGTYGQFINAVLDGIDAPITRNTQVAMMAWIAMESGWGVPKCTNNPMNTTYTYPGNTICNSVGVKKYKSILDGIDATVKTLKIKAYGYPNIVNAFQKNLPARSIGLAINMSGWVTGSTSNHKRGGYAITTIPTADADLEKYLNVRVS